MNDYQGEVWKRKNYISGRIPKVDAVRDLLSRINPDEIRSIHEEMVWKG